jgi:hypothetical protein
LEGWDLPAAGDDVSVRVLGAALPFPSRAADAATDETADAATDAAVECGGAQLGGRSRVPTGG